MPGTLLLLSLLACHGGDDTVETDGSGDTDADEGASAIPEASLDDADAAFTGASGDALGAGVTSSDGLLGGGPALVIGEMTAGKACAWDATVTGAHTPDDATTCFTGPRSDFAGYAVDGGDVDGDGIGDVVLGAFGADGGGTDRGVAMVILGPVAPGDVDLSTAAWARFEGTADLDYAGTSVRILGDVDGDGLPELAVGAPGNDDGGAGAGEVYLLRSPLPPGTSALSSAPTTIRGIGGFLRHGGASIGDGVGNAIADAGDVDGDGLHDVLVSAGGSQEDGYDRGRALLFFGPVADGALTRDQADAAFPGVQDKAWTGEPVLGAGDVDEDGKADVLVGANGSSPAAVYLFSGPSAGTTSVKDADAAFLGEQGDDALGFDVAAPGDTDGDGHADLAFGAPWNDRGGEDAGAVWVAYGPIAAGTWDAATMGRVWTAHTGDDAGHALTAVGDVDGDGLGDWLVGAPLSEGAGKAWLVSGRVQ